MEDYAIENIEHDISYENCHEKYLNLCSKVRQVQRSENMAGVLKHDGLVNIDFYPSLNGIQRPSRIVRLKMRNDNYYFVGFQQRDDPTLWEVTDDKQVLKNSKLLPFSVSYIGKRITGRKVSYESFHNAVLTLGKLDPTDDKKMEEIEDALFTIILFVAEGARFRWISHFVGKTFENRKSGVIEEWYKYIINHWKDLTKLAEIYSKANPQIKWPIEEPTPEDIKNMESYNYKILFSRDNPRLAAVCVMIPLIEKPTTSEAGPSKKRHSKKNAAQA